MKLTNAIIATIGYEKFILRDCDDAAALLRILKNSSAISYDVEAGVRNTFYRSRHNVGIEMIDITLNETETKKA